MSNKNGHSIFERLEREHERIRELLLEIDELAEQDPSDALRLFVQLGKLLDAHAAAEQAAFYPALAQSEDGKELAEVARQEHEEIAELAGDVRRADHDDEWRSCFIELKNAIEQHLTEEEDELFALARALEGQTLAEIDARYVAERQAARQGFDSSADASDIGDEEAADIAV